MTSPAARKGKMAEREVAGLLSALTGWPVVRRLRQGVALDCGDLDGVPSTCVQVKNYYDIGRAVREGLPGMRRQKANLGARYGVVLVRRRGQVGPHRWVAVLDLEDAARLLADASRSPTSCELCWDSGYAAPEVPCSCDARPYAQGTP